MAKEVKKLGSFQKLKSQKFTANKLDTPNLSGLNVPVDNVPKTPQSPVTNSTSTTANNSTANNVSANDIKIDEPQQNDRKLPTRTGNYNSTEEVPEELKGNIFAYGYYYSSGASSKQYAYKVSRNKSIKVNDLVNAVVHNRYNPNLVHERRFIITRITTRTPTNLPHTDMLQ
jgi:hypothetical protein